MFDLSELDKLKETKDRRAIPVVMLYLDENLEYTGEMKFLKIGGKAFKSTGVAHQSISQIIDQKNNRYTATHKNGRRVTFVNADATQKEIYKHLRRVKKQSISNPRFSKNDLH